jgi:pimeloyl-ACP methyl ester carboxylesterase
MSTAAAKSPPRMVSAGDVQIATYARGEGTPIVMINGLGAAAQDWGPLADRLSERARVIMFDNRGAGRSIAPAQPFSLERMAQDTVAVFEAYGLSSAKLIGHSMGGMIAQLVAVARPDLIERLVLIATHSGPQSAVPSTPEARAAMFPQEKLPREELVRRQFMVYVAPHFLEHRRDEFERMLATRLANLIPLEMWQLQLQAVLGSERAEAIRSIRAPTLILHGRADTLIPFANGEKLRDLIPGARLVALDDCGHIVNWEKPAEAAAAVGEFLGL